MMRVLLIFIAIGVSGASALELNLVKKAAFEETFERFPSPYAVLQQFKRIMPKDGNQYSHQECNRLDKMSAPVLGVNDPLQLSPLEQTPGELFYQYYIDCVRKVVAGGMSFASDAASNSRRILSGADMPALVELFKSQCQLFRYECDAGKDDFHLLIWTMTGWSTMSAEAKFQFMDAFVKWLVGPERILRAKGYIGDENAFAAELPDAASLTNFLVAHADTIMVNHQGNVATLKDIYAEIAITLRLGPALKN